MFLVHPTMARLVDIATISWEMLSRPGRTKLELRRGEPLILVWWHHFLSLADLINTPCNLVCDRNTILCAMHILVLLLCGSMFRRWERQRDFLWHSALVIRSNARDVVLQFFCSLPRLVFHPLFRDFVAAKPSLLGLRSASLRSCVLFRWVFGEGIFRRNTTQTHCFCFLPDASISPDREGARAQTLMDDVLQFTEAFSKIQFRAPLTSPRRAVFLGRPGPFDVRGLVELPRATSLF